MKMTSINRIKLAGIGLTTIFTLTIVFHLLVIIGVVPYSIVWGGRLTSLQDMYRFETVSLLLNFFFLWITLMKTGIMKPVFPLKVINGILWGMCVLFLINTIGNFFSINQWERIIFTPLTLVLSLFSGVLARSVLYRPVWN